ncbi:coagulation factor XIII B chain-like isoform X1 [Spea bombifrons]|uniref:coagulation factor XIII B chain-like isoform X1 n=1 Tax=Spea bombifrons TaxID=233779 RepID=UPI00234979FE|nr:coagulation factor XIII B chain-like isoform X1 [Spea bombifrons]
MNTKACFIKLFVLTSVTCLLVSSANGDSDGTCKVSAFKHGQHKPNKTLFKIGEQMQYECDDGYVSPKKTIVDTLECLSSGWSSVLQCAEIECTVHQKAGFSNKRTSYKNGEVESFSCDDGLKLYGSEVSQCYYYGWDPPLPICEDKKDQCPPVPQPNNTEKSPFKQSYSRGDKVQIKCLPNFRLHGPEWVFCKDGRWTSPPQCVWINQNCPAPPRVLNGEAKTEIRNQYPPGSSVEYQCQQYYKPQGNRKIVCQNGQWSDPPVCLEPCTVNQREMLKHNIQLRWTEVNKLYSEHDDAVEFVCLPGFQIQSSSTMRVKCNRGNLLYPKCDKQGIGQNCPAPPRVLNGEAKTEIRNQYPPGSSVEYHCQQYYKPQGNLKIVCQNGQWSDAPACLEPCTVNQKEMLKNNIQLRWTEVNKLYLEHDEAVEFVCVPGFQTQPSSAMRVRCNRRNLLYPKCDKQGSCLLSKETMLANFIKLKDSNVEIEEGSRVEFQCIEYMVPEQTLIATCSQGKIIYPRCIKQKSCILSEVMVQKNNLVLTGAVSKDMRYDHGAKISIRCKPGYFLVTFSSFKVECYNGIMTYPACFNEKPCRINQDRLDEKFLELHPDHQDKVFYHNEEIIKFVCKAGYSSLSDPFGKCIKEEIFYPTCQESG